ncbi:MerR family transcriptional regulator [Sporosalibacterium faouarense]|uniref:MerR family transcriptional regulator n=1 Tax=Sporosalibacterium faouarense TaxID=516123 RepID=UPI00141C3A4D|nr:MerR family transcriptional regulator [Sporosalibacterium faouarense]MTI49136.1 MerR family transcriptional regulator [Bacillota bacterium]
MKYTIGEFADMLGVTVDTLRLYEKHDIIKPIRDNRNNYRYFNDLDARDLLMSRWYRSIEIPLQEAAILTKDSSIDSIIEKIEETQLNLEEEIKRKSMLLNKITEINDSLRAIENKLNKCEKRKLPGIYRIKQTSKNTLLKDDHLRSIVDTWMNILPFSFYSCKIEYQEFLSNKDSFGYSWGLAIFEDCINDFEIKTDSNVEYIESKTYIYSVICNSQEDYITRKSLQHIVDYIEKNGYSIAGDIIGKIIVNEKFNNESKGYLEIYIPIQ